MQIISYHEQSRTAAIPRFTPGPSVLKLCNRPIIIVPVNRAREEIHIASDYTVSRGERGIAELFNVIGGMNSSPRTARGPRFNALQRRGAPFRPIRAERFDATIAVIKI